MRERAEIDGYRHSVFVWKLRARTMRSFLKTFFEWKCQAVSQETFGVDGVDTCVHVDSQSISFASFNRLCLFLNRTPKRSLKDGLM